MCEVDCESENVNSTPLKINVSNVIQFDFLVFPPSGPFTCIFSQNFSRAFPVLAVANIGSCVGPQNKIAYPAHRYRQLMQVPVLSAHGI